MAQASSLWRVLVGTGFQPVDDEPLTVVEAWITSRLQQVAQEVAARLDAYEFDLAANALTNSSGTNSATGTWNSSSPSSTPKSIPRPAAIARALLRILGAILKLLHPFMPFVTEEIWRITRGQGSVMVAPYPEADRIPAQSRRRNGA